MSPCKLIPPGSLSTSSLCTTHIDSRVRTLPDIRQKAIYDTEKVVMFGQIEEHGHGGKAVVVMIMEVSVSAMILNQDGSCVPSTIH
jgi:hypothetical protein